MKILPLLLSDHYKQNHYLMYESGTEKIYSNITARKSRVQGVNDITVFGIQYFLKRYLRQIWDNDFFAEDWETVEKQYTRIIDNTLGKDVVTLDHIRELHKLQYLPLEIKCVQEGETVPIRLPFLTITNTVDHAYWLVNFLESLLSCVVWQPITSATIAREYKKIAFRYGEETGANKDLIPWLFHDFSFRGMSSVESAMVSGAAHLIYFNGTDSIPAIPFIEEYYEGSVEKELIGGSCPATEHSVMCLSEEHGEIETFSRLLDLYPKGILSVVSDTWSLPNVVCRILPILKEKILKRDGKLVIRPDSFWTDPVDCICGFDGYHPKMDYMTKTEKKTIKMGLIESLYEIFGGSVNSKGYKTLNPCIGAIYGDSITLDRAEKICLRLKAKGFASDNWVAGVGSYTYQYNTRDTFGLAIKATYGVVNGKSRDIFKDPITDDGMKKSARGLIKVTKNIDNYTFQDRVSPEEEKRTDLRTIFQDGTIFNSLTFSQIRKNANKLFI